MHTHELDGDVALDGFRLARVEHDAHPSASQLLDDLEGADGGRNLDALADRQLGTGDGPGRLDEALLRVVTGEQRLNLGPKLGVAGARLVEIAGALELREGPRGEKERLDAGEAVGVQGIPECRPGVIDPQRGRVLRRATRRVPSAASSTK
jgi:hypothetical protein